VSFGVIEALRAARPDETSSSCTASIATPAAAAVARKPAALRTLHALHARWTGRESATSRS
jgi:hypothetical protein